MTNPIYHSHEGHDEEPSTIDRIVELQAAFKPYYGDQPIFCPMDLCDDGSSRDPRDCSCPYEKGIGLGIGDPFFGIPGQQKNNQIADGRFFQGQTQQKGLPRPPPSNIKLSDGTIIRVF